MEESKTDINKQKKLKDLFDYFSSKLDTISIYFTYNQVRIKRFALADGFVLSTLVLFSKS